MNRCRLALSLLIALCCATTSALADKKDAEKARQRFLKRFDTNKDGKVTKEESRAVLAKEAKQRATKRKAEASRQKFLKRFDTNRDGKISKEETRAVLAKESNQRAIKRKADTSRQAFLKRFDANRDGKVTKEEIKAVLAKEAKTRAAKGKAQPTKRAPKSPKRNAEDSRRRFLKRYDANRDGKVTKEEIKAVLAKEAEQRSKKAKKE